MKYFIKILVLILNISYVWLKCDISIEDADKCGINTAIFGNRNLVVPTTDAELVVHCSNIHKNMECIQGFVNQCLSGVVKQTTELVMKNNAKHLERRCDNPKDRQDFLNHIQCLSSKEKAEPFHICADKNLAMMEMVLNMDGEEAANAGCCIFHVFQDCIRQRNKEICGEETTDYWDEVINEIAEDSISLSCGGFESLNKCETSLNPKMWSDIKAIEAITDAQTLAAKHTHKSHISLMIDFMKKMSKDK